MSKSPCLNPPPTATPVRSPSADPPSVAFDASSLVIARVAGGLTAFFATTVLANWLLGIDALQMVMPGVPGMKANASLAYLLLGTSLYLLAGNRPGFWQLVVARGAAVATFALGAATLSQYSFGWRLGIDQLIVADRGVVFAPAPGRPSPGSALCFVLLSVSLLALRSPSGVWRWFVQLATLLTLSLALLSLVEYAYDVSALYRFPPFFFMALQSAATLILISVGILLSRRDFEIMAPLRSPSLGGLIARKLLPAILILPMIGWLRLRGEQWGLFDRELGQALSTLVVMVMLIGVVWSCARSLNQLDADRCRAEQSLRESERVYRAIGESIDYGVWLCDAEGRNTYVSPSFLKLAGITQEQCSDSGWVDVLAPHNAERTLEAWKKCVETRGKWDWEHHFRGADGNLRSVLARGVPITDEQGKLLSWAGINLDISQLKHVERQLQSAYDELEVRIQERTAELTNVNEMLRRSLEEKEVLLREVHHRVKNNLQVVSSLLHLQSLNTRDSASVAMFQESRLRVQSMALVHERLYRSRDLAQIEFTDYLQGLANSLFESYRIDTGRIRLETHVDQVRLAIDTAVPCGLLINELVSNCLKHAFAGRTRGCIRIELQAITEHEVLLCVADDGIGLPPEIEPESVQSFGLQVVTALVDQLHGTFEVRRNEGTEIHIRFPRIDTTSKAVHH